MQSDNLILIIKMYYWPTKNNWWEKNNHPKPDHELRTNEIPIVSKSINYQKIQPSTEDYLDQKFPYFIDHSNTFSKMILQKMSA